MKLLRHATWALLSVALITCKSADLQTGGTPLSVGAGLTNVGPAKLKALTNPALNNAGTSSQLNFSVERTSQSLVRISWRSLAYAENQGFIIQRSEDGVNWTNVHFQPGQGDKKSRPYSYTDTLAKSVYYRLGELDEAMHMEYSPVWYLVAPAALARFGAQLNPLRRSVQLVGSDPTKPVDVLNSSGQLVQVVMGSSFSTREMMPGMYAIRQGSRVVRLQVR